MTKDNASAALVAKPGEGTSVVDHKNIYEAFIAIMNEVGYVQKTGINKAQNYKYAGEAQLIETLRPVMLKHGVLCVPGEAKVCKVDHIVVGAIGSEKKTYRTVIRYTFVYTHAASSTHLQVQAIGEGVDTGDKAAYKAATGALKYALRQAFLIETGDDPEKDDDKDIPKREVTASVFSNAAKRKDFEAKLTKEMEAAPDLGELRAVWKDALPILTELKESESDYENTSYEHLVKMKDQIKATIESLGMNDGIKY